VEYNLTKIANFSLICMQHKTGQDYQNAKNL